MNKTLEEIKRENSFSGIIANSGDEIKNIVKEIYYDGMVEGYHLAISSLQVFDRIPLDGGDDYMEKNGDKIKNILEAVYELHFSHRDKG